MKPTPEEKTTCLTSPWLNYIPVVLILSMFIVLLYLLHMQNQQLQKYRLRLDMKDAVTARCLDTLQNCVNVVDAHSVLCNRVVKETPCQTP